MVGAYQLQAAIAALHDEAARSEDTDWPQILALYSLLKRMSDNPMVTLNHAIAAAMVHGPTTGLKLIETLDADPRMTGHYRLDAVRGHLLEMAGERDAASPAIARQLRGLPAYRSATTWRPKPLAWPRATRATDNTDNTGRGQHEPRTTRTTQRIRTLDRAVGNRVFREILARITPTTHVNFPFCNPCCLCVRARVLRVVRGPALSVLSVAQETRAVRGGA